ncbi:hypothetical protein OF001_U190048 [Pseudomonas sp. OF001]|nr:hypothetical protein OF001_U190048 [Pseudomonas sp. OF001]
MVPRTKNTKCIQHIENSQSTHSQH